MIKLTEEIIQMIVSHEGYAGLNRHTEATKHSKTYSDYGAYYDSRGYLTTGFGSKISEAPKGSPEEAADIEKWQKTMGMDPFNLTEDDALNKILPIDFNRTLATAQRQLGDVDMNTLPDPVKVAIASLAYNTGQLGPNTAKKINEVSKNPTRHGWDEVADMFENWHGALSEKQEKGVLLRRKDEADKIRGYNTLFEEETPEDFLAPKQSPLSYDGESLENAAGTLDLYNRNQATTNELSTNLRAPASIDTKPLERRDISVDMSNTPYSEDLGALDLAAKKQAQTVADSSIGEKIGAFGNHLHNSFMTENVFVDVSNKAISRLMGNVPDTTYDPSFRPTKMSDFNELTQGIENDTLKGILKDSPNRETFFNKIQHYRKEEQARQEIAEYFEQNPISGFLGIGAASVLDPMFWKSGPIAPVVGAMKLGRLAKYTKSLSHSQRIIATTVGKNVAEELAQEAYLIANSDIRKFEDGDLLVGLVGSVLLSGTLGTLTAAKAADNFDIRFKKYGQEKNIAGLENMLKVAEKRNLPSEVKSQIQTLIRNAEVDMTNAHKARLVSEVLEQQTKLGKQLIDVNKLDMVRRLDDFETSIDLQIKKVKEQPDPIQKVIRDTKEGTKVTRLELQENLNKLHKELGDTRKLLRREEGKNLKGVERSRFISDLKSKLDSKAKEIKELKKTMKKTAKEVSRAKSKAVRHAKKMDDPRQLEIKRLENIKKSHKEQLQKVYNEKVDQISRREHPAQADLLTGPKLEELSEYLGLPKVFKNLDEIDEFIDLEFIDSAHKSVGAAQVKFKGFAKGGSTDAFFNKIDPDLWNVMSREAQDARLNPASGLSVHQVKKDSAYAKLLRATGLHKLLTTESTLGRLILNKSALRTSDNEFVSGFYNLLSPDSVGRVGQGRLSMIEKQQQIVSIYGGTLRDKMLTGIQDLDQHAISNTQLRKALELPENDLAARVMLTEVYHPEKVALLLRDELLESGSSRLKFGDEVADILERMADDFNKVQSDLARRLKDSGVLGAENLAEGDGAKGWFHRTWSNEKVREFHHKYGDKKLTELVDNSMQKYLVDNGVELNEELLKDLKRQAKKFAFGLHNADLEVNRGATLGMSDFLEDLIAKNKDGLDVDVLKDELSALKDRQNRVKLRELGKRKTLDLNGTVKLQDGSTFSMKELLEDNLFSSQMRYIETASARIAAAESGLKDLDMLEDWRKAAVELELSRGNKEVAKYIDNSMKVDIRSFKYGTQSGLDDFDGGLSRLLSMAKKYQFARLMQYYGISFISEAGSAIPEAGYKAVAQVISTDLSNKIKSLFLGGITGKRFRDAMSDELGVLTGIGLDSIGFDSLVSSSDRLARSTVGKGFERFIDNAAKATSRATGHIETMGRKMIINSLGIGMGNVALGRSRLDSLWGGLTNRNLVEMGLAELGPDGKAVYNTKWDNIVDSIKKYATDETGQLASETGSNIKEFNIAKWDLETRRAFGDALTIQANHIIVNPDTTTAKLWMNSPVGSIYNQFRTFSNNAASKVAGHNVHQAIQGYNMGSMAEFSKTAQKMFWSAALGKLSLVLYGSIHEAGRPDFEERIQKYISMDDPRDWTRALGRGSVITGLDGPLDTVLGAFGVDPLFDNSTIGQSRNRFDILNTPTGQLVQGVQRTATKAASGDVSGASKELIKMSPIRRAIGVNQLLNSLGMD